MFVRVEIHLAGPICSCQKQNLTWGIIDTAGGHGLFLRCKSCGVEVRVPHNEFKAGFRLGQQYPEGEGAPKPEVKRESKGKVIELFPVGKEK